MKKLKFIGSRFDAEWSFQLWDGRIIEVLPLDGEHKMLSIRFDTPINLETGEIGEQPEYTPFAKDEKPLPDGFTTLNKLIGAGRGKPLYCYDEYDVFVGRVRSLSQKRIDKIIDEFKQHGFNVTQEAIMYNWSSYVGDFKSGFRDEKNGYHLFTPCRCNPLSFRATTLHPACADWQKTYFG